MSEETQHTGKAIGMEHLKQLHGDGWDVRYFRDVADGPICRVVATKGDRRITVTDKETLDAVTVIEAKREDEEVEAFLRWMVRDYHERNDPSEAWKR